MNANVVVRITCDCPLIDPAVIGQAIALREARNADYAANVIERDWPHGLDCEVFPRSILDAPARSPPTPTTANTSRRGSGIRQRKRNIG